MSRPNSFDDPTLALLVRAAMPTAKELTGAETRRQAIEADRELFRIYREARKSNCLADLHPTAREYVEMRAARNGGKIPNAQGGRTKAEALPFAMAVEIVLSLMRQGVSLEDALLPGTGRPQRRTVAAINSVAAMAGRSFESARAAYYGTWTKTREGRHAIRVEIATRRLEARRAVSMYKAGNLPRLKLAIALQRRKRADLGALAALEPRGRTRPSRAQGKLGSPRRE